MTSEDTAHSPDSFGSCRMGQDVEQDPERPEEAFIVDHTFGFQQMHGVCYHLPYGKAFVFQQLFPFGCRQGATFERIAPCISR